MKYINNPISIKKHLAGMPLMAMAKPSEKET